MQSGEFKLIKRELLPQKQVNVYLGIEFLLNTYHEMNFSDSDEKVQSPNLDEIDFDIWFSWN